MDIEELSKKVDKYHEEDKKRAEKDKKENIGYIAYGFALATLGLTVTSVRIMDIVVYAIAAVVFFVVGTRELRQSQKIKVD